VQLRIHHEANIYDSCRSNRKGSSFDLLQKLTSRLLAENGTAPPLHGVCQRTHAPMDPDERSHGPTSARAEVGPCIDRAASAIALGLYCAPANGHTFKFIASY
jgi:hypothetical protein